MSSTQRRYRIYCTTDNKWEKTVSPTPPTQCPVNPAHGVNLNSVSIIRKVPKEEFVVTVNAAGKRKLKRYHAHNDSVTSIMIDDFQGSNLLPIWSSNTVGIGSNVDIVDGVGGIVELLTDANISDSAELTTNNSSITIGSAAQIKGRLKLSHIIHTRVEFGATFDSGNEVLFLYDVAGTGGNWQSITRAAATTTQTDTGVVADTSWHIFMLKCRSTKVDFLIDGNIVTTHNTDLPGQLMRIIAKQTTNTTAARNTKVDYIRLTSDRDGNPEGSSMVGSCTIL